MGAIPGSLALTGALGDHAYKDNYFLGLLSLWSKVLDYIHLLASASLSSLVSSFFVQQHSIRSPRHGDSEPLFLVHQIKKK